MHDICRNLFALYSTIPVRYAVVKRQAPVMWRKLISYRSPNRLCLFDPEFFHVSSLHSGEFSCKVFDFTRSCATSQGIFLNFISKWEFKLMCGRQAVIIGVVVIDDIRPKHILNGNIFRVTGHLCVKFTGHRWMPRTKASDAELWCFLWSASE